MLALRGIHKDDVEKGVNKSHCCIAKVLSQSVLCTSYLATP